MTAALDWGRLSPAEDATVWAMRAEGAAFVAIASTIIRGRSAIGAKCGGQTPVALRRCACGAVFRIRPEREDYRRCLPCRRHA